MEPAEALHEEHVLISRMVSALETYVDAVKEGSNEYRHDLLLMVTFFREFADLVHHEKEESLVLPSLVRAGMSWENGTIDEICKEHNLERYLMQSLRHASLQSREWSADDRCHLVEVATSFIDFMRRHIAKEETYLLPELEARLAGDDADRLRERLQRFDTRWRDSGEADVIGTLTEEILHRYPPKSKAQIG